MHYYVQNLKKKITFIPAPIAQTPLAKIATVLSPRDSVAHDATHIVQQYTTIYVVVVHIIVGCCTLKYLIILINIIN